MSTSRHAPEAIWTQLRRAGLRVTPLRRRLVRLFAASGRWYSPQELRAAAEKAGRPMATLSATTEVRLRSPRERQAFAEELLDAITKLVDKYHDSNARDGRSYRLVVGAHPIRASRRKS